MASARTTDIYVGFDLGGTKMIAGIFDSRLRRIRFARKKTRSGVGEKSGVDRMIQLIREALDAADIRPSRVRGIGVGCPGPLDLRRGVILEAPNLGWRNVPLRKRLQQAFRCPVVIANDVDAGTYGEYRLGAARKARTVVGIFPGTGVGGAAIYQGRLIRGKTGSCMEIGHLTVEPGGRLCGCGRRGCLETVASRLAVSAEAAAAVFRGEAPHLARMAGTDLAKIRSGALRDAVKAGDVVVERILRRAAARLGMAVGQLVNLFAPDVVVLGGGMIEALGGLMLPECRRAAEAQAMDAYRGTFRIVAARLGDDAVIAGAAALAATPEALA
jgi:glucokinase